MTTMTRLIDEERGQIGIFRALGFSNIQIIGKYCFYAFSASIIGGVIGIFLGQVIFPTVIYETWRLMYNLPSFKLVYPAWVVILCLISFSFLMMLISTIVLHKQLKEVPASLLRPKAPKSAKKIILEKISLIWDKLSFTSKITARNIFRYKSRFFMTLIGVAGCTGLLIIGWGVKDSISNIVEIQFGDIFNYDYQVYVENDHNIDESIDTLLTDLDNEIAVPYMSYTTKGYFEDEEETATAIVINNRDGLGIFNLREKDHKTSIRLDNSGIVVSEKYAKNNNIKIGDYITIESENGLKATAKVENICEMYFQHYIFISDSYYESIFDEAVNYNIIAVKSSNENFLDEAKSISDFVSVTDFSSMISQFETMIEALDLIILVIIITAGSLAFVVIINLTQVNISERAREIATLKVLGFHNTEVNNYIFKEIIILTILGGITGLPLGVLEHHFITNVINMDMVMFSMKISVFTYIYAFSITLIFTFIVMLFMRKPLRKIDMIESLKSVE